MSRSGAVLDSYGFQIHEGDAVQFDTAECRLWGIAVVDGSPAGQLLVELDQGQEVSGIVPVALDGSARLTLLGGAA